MFFSFLFLNLLYTGSSCVLAERKTKNKKSLSLAFCQFISAACMFKSFFFVYRYQGGKSGSTSAPTPTVLPSYFHGTPTLLPSYFHGTPTLLPSYSHGTPMILPNTSMVLPGTPIVLPSYSRRTPTVLP